MDEQVKPESAVKPPATSDAGAGPRDLSFLWPLLDRIRAVEIKLQGDSAPEPAHDIEARLMALEDAVAAIGRTLREALGTPTDGARIVAAQTAERQELSSQSWIRAV